jgi:Na+/proline symporter
VLVVFAALMALMIWLGSLGNGGSENFNDYWPMML